MKFTRMFGAMTLALSLAVPTLQAQQEHADNRPMKTFYLKNVVQPNDANEELVALRNLLDPTVKIYLVASQNAILIRASEEDLQRAQTILDALDRPHKHYRLTFTLTQMEDGKPVGTRHVSLVVVSGMRTTLKGGSKVPVVTGSYKTDEGAQTQNTYLDVGTNIDVTLTDVGEGAELKSKIEESALSEERSGIGTQDPVVRQTVIEGVSLLTPGKPLMLGALDRPGSHQHEEISVVMEPVK